MKFNWGWGVVIAFVCFAAFILSMVIRSFDVPINMVSKEYYAEELAYSDKKAKMENTKQLEEQPRVEYQLENEALVVAMPDEAANANGTVKLYRPADSRMDFTEALVLDSDNKQQIEVNNIAKGRWVVQLDWEKAGKSYYFEKSVIIP
ncbi:FixH family protein [Limibacter armeniacum]|uniref:FixH family protein n=1 Tax=Limibacter armeniacum TaxID=466084 RepID=UPI002FE4FDEE